MISEFRKAIESSKWLKGTLSDEQPHLLAGLAQAWIAVTQSCALLPAPKRADFFLATLCCLKKQNADRDAPQVASLICRRLFQAIRSSARSGGGEEEAAAAATVAQLLENLLFANNKEYTDFVTCAVRSETSAMVSDDDEVGFFRCIQFFGCEARSAVTKGSPPATVLLTRAFADVMFAAVTPRLLERTILHLRSGGKSIFSRQELATVLSSAANFLSTATAVEQFWNDRLRPAANSLLASSLPRETDITAFDLLEGTLTNGVVDCASALPPGLRDNLYRLVLTAVGQLSSPPTLVAAKVLDICVRKIVRSSSGGGMSGIGVGVVPEAVVELIRCVSSNDQDRQAFEEEFLRLTSLRLLTSTPLDDHHGIQAEVLVWQLLEHRCPSSKGFLHRFRSMFGVALAAQIPPSSSISSSKLLVAGELNLTGLVNPTACTVRAVPAEYFSIFSSPLGLIPSLPKEMLAWPQGKVDLSTESNLLQRNLAASVFPAEVVWQRKFSWGSTPLLAAEVEIWWEDPKKNRSSSIGVLSIPHLHVLEALCVCGKGVLSVGDLHELLPPSTRPDRAVVTEGLMRSAPFLRLLEHQALPDICRFQTNPASGQSRRAFAALDGVIGEAGVTSFRRLAASGARKSAASVVSKSDLARCEAGVVRYLKKRDSADFVLLCDDLMKMLEASGGPVERAAVKAAVDSLVGKEMVELLPDGSFKYKP